MTFICEYIHIILSVIQKLDQLQISIIQSHVTITYYVHLHAYCIITHLFIALLEVLKTLPISDHVIRSYGWVLERVFSDEPTVETVQIFHHIPSL